jgi:caa(3)-type oxidase subunit IV
MADHAHNPNKYRNIYIALLVLLAVSIIGPEFGILWLTLVTAFGIALVKSWMVVREFMHLKDERRIIVWVLAGSLLLMFLLFAGVAPDILNHEGANWVNYSAQEAIERGIETDPH